MLAVTWRAAQLGGVNTHIPGTLGRLTIIGVQGFGVGLSLAMSSVSGMYLVLTKLGVMVPTLPPVAAFGSTVVSIAVLLTVVSIGAKMFPAQNIFARFNERFPNRKNSGTREVYESLRDGMITLDKEIEGLNGKIALLDQHSSEYFNLLTSLGWSRLISIRDQLKEARRNVGELIDAERLEDALELVDFLLGNSRAFFPSLRELTSVPLSMVQDWHVETEKQIRRIMAALSAASENNRSIGVRRPRRRSTTIHSISELRRLLMIGSAPPSRGTSSDGWSQIMGAAS